MPRRVTPSDQRWPLPGELYGYVENRRGVATFRYNSRYYSLGKPFDPARKKELIGDAMDKLQRLRDVERGLIDSVQARRSATISQATAEFWVARQIDKRSSSARFILSRGLGKVFPNGGLRVTDGTIHEHLVQRIAELRRHYAESSVAQFCDKADELLRYCRGRLWLKADPWATIPRPKAARKGAARSLSPAEITRLYRYLLTPTHSQAETDRRRELAALVQLLNATGMRPSEALSLRWGDAIDSPEGINTVDPDRIILRTTKNGVREIPLDRSIPQTARIARAIDRCRRLRGERRTKGARLWAMTYRTAATYISEAFDAVGIVAKSDARSSWSERRQHRLYLFRATVEQRWMREGITEATAIRVIGHTKEIRRKHYAETPTAEDAIREMRRDLGL